ncbi:hypothetical protein F3Y22_tig00110213pilonHSYRG00239 [Hibiscus syriacus]|uniref:Uncharacterized protein n=1 Tax=Hibiscus syriacus TaxID=106335 RepID=A0A6A3BAS6_HIBSY|nr:hypothetical protein F3Y22_tig00110213pilonHSYRG00239 [Hibiscus syriacus]
MFCAKSSFCAKRPIAKLLFVPFTSKSNHKAIQTRIPFDPPSDQHPQPLNYQQTPDVFDGTYSTAHSLTSFQEFFFSGSTPPATPQYHLCVHVDIKKPTMKVYCKANPSYNLTIRRGKVVLAPSDPSDEFQYWYKDEKFSSSVKDEADFDPQVQLVPYKSDVLDESILRSASNDVRDGYKAIRMHWYKDEKFSSRVKDDEGFLGFSCLKVLLVPYQPDVLDESVLWSASNEVRDGYKAIRMVANTHLNLDAFTGNGSSYNGIIGDACNMVPAVELSHQTIAALRYLLRVFSFHYVRKRLGHPSDDTLRKLLKTWTVAIGEAVLGSDRLLLPLVFGYSSSDGIR